MNERSTARLFVLKVTVVSLLLTLGGRVWFLQVLAGDQYATAAANNNRREIVEPAIRGRILDDYGRPLVQNRTALVVSVDRIKLLRQKDRGAAVLARLSKVVGLPLAELKNKITLCGRHALPAGCWNGSPYQPIQITNGADDAMAQQIQERQELFPGVTARLSAVRDYPKPLGINAAHMLGYLSPVTDAELKKDGRRGDVVLQGTELVGRSGLESVYDNYLRGQPATTVVAVDARGAVTGTLDSGAGQPGDSLVTSLDARVQRAAEVALAHAVKRARGMTDRKGKLYRADSAAAVVLDVRTGRVIAMASYPSYDPNIWVGGISQKDYSALLDERAGVPLIFRPTQGGFAPGSTFKPISTAAVVADGYGLHSTYPCPSSYRVGNRTFRNFEGETLGSITLKTALIKSCDTVYYKLGFEEWLRDQQRPKPKEVMVAMAKRWGLGSKTGIDLPDERTGRIASRAFKKLFWEQRKADYCKGAENPKFDAERRRADREFCLEGYRYRAGDAVNFAIGQGDTIVTPLQLAVAYAALANGGTVLRPQIGRAVVSADGKLVKEIKPSVKGQLGVPQDVLAYMRDALGGVPTEGTARGAFGAGISGFPGAFPMDRVHVAGKTGTAEVAGKQDSAWFASFAPVQSPRFAVVVMVTQGGQGGRVAAPAVREIYDAIYGLEGQTAAFPNGVPPTALPKIAPDGSVVAPRVGPPRPVTPTPSPTALSEYGVFERRYRAAL